MQHKIYIRAVAKIRPQILKEAIKIVTVEEDAEDIVQETLLKLWLLRERCATEEKMRAMASIITRNLCLNHNRQRKETILIEQTKDIRHSSTPEAERIERENENMLALAANRMPDHYRAILNMRNVEGGVIP